MTHIQRVSTGVGVAAAAGLVGLFLLAPSASAATFSSPFTSNEMLSVHGGDVCTVSREIQLDVSAKNADQVRLALDDQFIGADWRRLTGDPVTVTLPEYDATYTIYAQFRTNMGNKSRVLTLPVELDQQFGCEDSTDALFAPILNLLEQRVLEEEAMIGPDEELSDEALQRIFSEIEAEILPLLEDDAWLADLEKQLEGFGPEILALIEGVELEESDEAQINEGEVDLDKEEAVTKDGLAAGELVRSQTAPAVYHVGEDKQLHVFERDVIFESWGHDTADVRVLSDASIARMHKGAAMPAAPGALIKTTSEPAVWMVEAGPARRHIVNEDVARETFGSNWAEDVIDVTQQVLDRYTILPPFNL